MPRLVRNFFVKLQVDGRKTPIASGPRKRDGGFECYIYQRERGEVSAPLLVVYGTVTFDNLLRLRVTYKGTELLTVTTAR